MAYYCPNCGTEVQRLGDLCPLCAFDPREAPALSPESKWRTIAKRRLNAKPRLLTGLPAVDWLIGAVAAIGALYGFYAAGFSEAFAASEIVVIALGSIGLYRFRSMLSGFYTVVTLLVLLAAGVLMVCGPFLIGIGR